MQTVPDTLNDSHELLIGAGDLDPAQPEVGPKAPDTPWNGKCYVARTNAQGLARLAPIHVAIHGADVLIISAPPREFTHGPRPGRSTAPRTVPDSTPSQDPAETCLEQPTIRTIWADREHPTGTFRQGHMTLQQRRESARVENRSHKQGATTRTTR